MSLRQVIVVAVTVGLCALDGFDVLAISFASPGISSEWGIDRAALGFVLSMELLGMAIGNVVMGRFADAWGRRPIILFCVTLMAIGMWMATTANSIYDLSFWRVVTGMGIGGTLSAINAVAAEFANENASQLVCFADGHRLSNRRGDRRHDCGQPLARQQLALRFRIRRIRDCNNDPGCVFFCSGICRLAL